MKYSRALALSFFSLLILTLNFLFPPDTVKPASADGDAVLPILMYHQVLDKADKLGKYVVSPRELEADLRLLSEQGYETVTIRDLVDFSEGKRALPKKSVMLTFDDGYQTDYLNVFPLLKKYNMKAVFSVVGTYTERYSTPGIDKHINYAHLSWNEISEMQESGLCEFQNHSYNLHSLTDRHGALQISGEAENDYLGIVHNDLKTSQKLLTGKLGAPPLCFTYPYGGTNELLRKLVPDEGFAASLGTYEQINVLTGDSSELFDLRRFNRAHGRNIKKILEKAEKLRSRG